jgi:hypothetical protein
VHAAEPVCHGCHAGRACRAARQRVLPDTRSRQGRRERRRMVSRVCIDDATLGDSEHRAEFPD